MSAYPVTFEADYVEERSRLTTFFRLILVIPQMIWAFFYGIAAMLAIVAAWFMIVITGNYPPGLYDFVAGFNRWITQVSAYALLLTDDYPPFVGVAEYPIRMGFGGPLPEYNRMKTLFRLILGIPIMVLRYVLGILLEIGAVGAWFVIVITGKQIRGLQEIMELGLSYTARSDAYLFLLTETYPPFQDDTGELSATTARGAIAPAAADAEMPVAPPAEAPAPSEGSGPEAPPSGPQSPA